MLPGGILDFEYQGKGCPVSILKFTESLVEEGSSGCVICVAKQCGLYFFKP